MQGKKINVLQIVGNARLGGVASCVLNYYRHTDLSRFHFDFVTYAPSVFDELVHAVDKSARIYYISPFQKNFLKGVFDLERICSDADYSVMHSHLTTLSAFSLTAAAHTDIPVRICHVHSAFNKNSEHYLAKSFLRPFAAEHATHLMACSRYAAENIFGKRADEATILPDAIEAAKFYSCEEDYKAARKELDLSGKVVLFVGRFAHQKNIPFLIEAFAKAAANENMTLAIVGDGEDKRAVYDAAKASGVKDKIRIVGPCDPIPWYKAADVFCLPSRYEGLGMAAIEAQTAGLKCILSSAVPREADITGKCLFLNEDADLWAEELIKPAEHFYDCKKLIEDAHYDIVREAWRLGKFYEDALNGQSGK